MRIISKFRDYYDGVQRQGFDASLVYVRETADVGFIDLPYERLITTDAFFQKGTGTRFDVTFERFFVVFCGQVYSRFQASTSWIVWDRHRAENIRDGYSVLGDSKKEVRDDVISHLNLVDPEKSRKSWYRGVPWAPTVDFDEEAGKIDWASIHRQFKAPIIQVTELGNGDAEKIPAHARNHYRWFKLVKNPKLQDMGFYQIMDAYQCYQQLSMYLGGVMGVDARPMVELTDKERHQKHGMDKWSFRKMPEKKN